MSRPIYHLTSAAAWSEGKRAGTYRHESLEEEGFIHCSTLGQVLPVANTFLRGTHGLVLLEIDPGKLESELQWEAPAHPNPSISAPALEGAEFPHVYGPINVDAVEAAYTFEPDARGIFELPGELRGKR